MNFVCVRVCEIFHTFFLKTSLNQPSTKYFVLLKQGSILVGLSPKTVCLVLIVKPRPRVFGFWALGFGAWGLDN